MQLGEMDQKRRWSVGAAASGLMQAKHLQAAGDGEEKDGRRKENPDVEVGEAGSFQHCGRRHVAMEPVVGRCERSGAVRLLCLALIGPASLFVE